MRGFLYMVYQSHYIMCKSLYMRQHLYMPDFLYMMRTISQLSCDKVSAVRCDCNLSPLARLHGGHCSLLMHRCRWDTVAWVRTSPSARLYRWNTVAWVRVHVPKKVNWNLKLNFIECPIIKHLILSPDSLWRFCPWTVCEDFVPGLFVKNVDNS